MRRWLFFLGMVFFLCACGAKRPVAVAPSPQAEVLPRVTGEEMVVEAEGLAYMGDEDTLSAVRQRAREDAFRKLLDKGARLYLETYRERSFGMLTEDRVREVMAGVIREVETLEEGLEGNVYRVRLRARVAPTDISRLLLEPVPKAPPAPTERASSPAGISPVGTSRVCFHRFTEVYTARIFPVLVRAPGLRRLERLAGYGPGTICYRLYLSGEVSPEELEAYLRENFRLSPVRPFRMRSNSSRRTIDLYFDAGFE